jgi:hypothetical protein
MAFQFDERPGSGRLTANPPTKILEYVAEGITDENSVHAYAIGFTPAIVATPMGLLHRQDVTLEPQGHDVYFVSVPYAQKKKIVGSWHFSFSTTGGTTHIENSGPFGGTIATYKADGADDDPDFKDTIGFVTADRVEGVDKVSPALRFTIHYKHPLGIITLAQMKAIARATGTVNSTPFLNFAAGEILFLGADGGEGTDSETEVSYHFEASENVTNLAVGDVVVVTKNGHDYAWIKYKDIDSDNNPTRIPRYVMVERIYTRVNLALILGIY